MPLNIALFGHEAEAQESIDVAVDKSLLSEQSGQLEQAEQIESEALLETPAESPPQAQPQVEQDVDPEAEELASSTPPQVPEVQTEAPPIPEISATTTIPLLPIEEQNSSSSSPRSLDTEATTTVATTTNLIDAIANIAKDVSDGLDIPGEEDFSMIKQDESIQFEEENINVDMPSDLTEHIVVSDNLKKALVDLRLRPINAKKGEVEVHDNKVTYKDVYQSTDFEYIVNTNNLKELIILKDANHPAEFNYFLNFNDYDVKQVGDREIVVYKKGHKGESLFKIFTISAPFMTDATGEISKNLSFSMSGEILKLSIDEEWLKTAEYPIVIDPTIGIDVLNVHSHPMEGEYWNVDFVTQGMGDLTITPGDSATVNDDQFASLFCGTEDRTQNAQILEGDAIYYPNWECDSVATVSHLTLRSGNHHLKFYFAGESEDAHSEAFNAAYTWDGGGGDALWTTAANWSSDIVPSYVDTVTFDNTCVTNCSPTINASTTIAGFTMSSTYAGTVTLSGQFDFRVNGAVSVSGGTFVGNTGTTTIFNGNFTVASGATYNAASTTIFQSTSASGHTLNINTTQNFHKLEFVRTLNSFNISTGDTLVAAGDLYLTSGGVAGGAIDVRGNIYQSSSFTGGSAIIDFGNDSSSQTYTYNGGTGPILRWDSASDSNDTLLLNAAPSFFGFTITAGTPNITNLSSYTLTFTSGTGASGLTQSGGTFNGGTGQMTFSDVSLTISGGTFTAASTTVFSGSSATNFNIDVNSTQNFYDVTFNKTSGAWNIGSGDTLVIENDLTLTSAELRTGTLDVRGDITQASGMRGSSATIDFGNDSVVQTYTYDGGTGPILRWDSASDSNDVLVLNAAPTFNRFIVSAGTPNITNLSSYTLTLTSPLTGVAFTQTGGTFNGGTGQMTITDSSFNISGGTFTAASTTLFSGSSATNYGLDINSSQRFHDVTFNKTSGQWVLGSGDTLVIEGDLTLTNAQLTNGTIDANGDVTVGSGYRGGTATLLFSGSSSEGQTNQNFDLTGGTGTFNADITVNKTEGTVTLLSALVMDAASQDLAITGGTFDLNGNNLTVNGTSGAMTVASGTTLQLIGSETITANANNPSIAWGSTVKYTGSAGPYTLKDYTYHHLDLSGTGTFSASSGTTTVKGNFSNLGTLTHNNGVFYFDGMNQRITGTTTFYSIFKATTTSDTLYFGANQTQTITGTTTLTGTNNNLLQLRSTSQGTQWKIDPQGSRTISYVSVRDSNNINASAIVDNGTFSNVANNTNWSFSGSNQEPDEPINLGPSRFVSNEWASSTDVTLTFDLADPDVADTVKYRIIIDNDSDYSSPTVDYTSALAAQGSFSFTVGQAAGSGTYLVGSEGQVLADSSTYYWKVKTIDNSGAESLYSSANSGSIAFKLDTGEPTPGTISFTVLSTYIYTTSAGASDTISGSITYNMVNNTTGSSSGIQSAGIWQNTGLTPNTQYSYHIDIYDLAGNSSSTPNQSKYTAAAIPSSVSAVADSISQVTLSWSANGNPAGTEYYAENPDDTAINSGWITDQSYAFTGLTCDVSYNFHVRARNNEGTLTSFSSTASPATNPCNTDPSVPGTLYPLALTNGDTITDNTPDTTFFIYDPDSSDTVRFRIQFSTTPNYSDIVVDYTSALGAQGQKSFAVGQSAGSGSYAVGSSGQTLDYSKDYYWRVKVIDQNGAESAYKDANASGRAFRLAAPTPPSSSGGGGGGSSGGSPVISVAPTYSLKINEDDVITTTGNVILRFSPPASTTNVDISNDQGFSLKENRQYSELATWNICEPNCIKGKKYSVFVRFLDSNGDMLASVSDIIYYYYAPGMPGYEPPLIIPEPVDPGIPVATSSSGVVVTTPPAIDPGDDASSGGGNIIDTVGGTIVDTVGGIGNTIGGIGDTVGSIGSTISETVVSIVPKVEDVVEAIGAIGGTISSTAQNTKVVVVQLTDYATDVVRSSQAQVVSGIGTLALMPSIMMARYSVSVGHFFANIKSISDVYYSIIGFLQGLLTSLGMRKRRRVWGTVYDSVTKQPLDPAIVDLISIETGKTIQTSITDLYGRFGFLDRPGRYKISAKKTHYSFPSNIVKGYNDGAFTNVYHGEEFEIIGENDDIIAPNIPMDQVAADWNQEEKKRMGIGSATSKIEDFVVKFLQITFWSGFLAMVFVLYASPTKLNITFFAVYVLLAVINSRIPHLRLWGRVLKDGMPVEGAMLELKFPQLENVVAGKAFTNNVGKYFLKAPAGEYTLFVKKVGEEENSLLMTKHAVVGKDMIFNEIINLPDDPPPKQQSI